MLVRFDHRWPVLAANQQNDKYYDEKRGSIHLELLFAVPLRVFALRVCTPTTTTLLIPIRSYEMPVLAPLSERCNERLRTWVNPARQSDWSGRRNENGPRRAGCAGRLVGWRQFAVRGGDRQLWKPPQRDPASSYGAYWYGGRRQRAGRRQFGKTVECGFAAANWPAGFSCPDLWPFEAIRNRVLWEAEMQA